MIIGQLIEDRDIEIQRLLKINDVLVKRTTGERSAQNYDRNDMIGYGT